MENYKLINILIKDMLEMENLISGIKLNRSYEPLEIEFLQTRVKGARQLLELLQNRNEPGTAEAFATQPPKETAAPAPEIKTEKAVEEIAEEEKPEGNKSPAGFEKAKAPVGQEKPEKAMEDKEGTPIQEEKNEGSDNNSRDEMPLNEEDEQQEKARTLGDSLLKEKSVNDMISGSSGNLEYKLSNRPLSSLESAIGINDRFLFTRELFDGNGEDFNSALVKLDSMNSIQEAVAYLRDNFKWKKNETSLKFISLVKRRFANE
ncbi:MAG: hypothetical protein GXO81_01250 [Chlorobi bacterium]|nr:hypothetical protein [Chlorobiota bacterium]